MSTPNPKSAFEYFTKNVFDTLRNDAGLLILFNGGPVKIDHYRGERQDQMPYILYTLRVRSDESNEFMKYGRMYLSVWDFNPVASRTMQTADRIQCALNQLGFADVPHIINAQRIYEVYSMEEMPTDSEHVQRIDLTFNVRYYDVKSVIEKVSRSVPNVTG